MAKTVKERKPIWEIDVRGSSNIVRALFNVRTSKLMVQFKGGGRYVYSDVDVETIVDLTLADSVGSFFARNIKDIHEFKRLDD